MTAGSRSFSEEEMATTMKSDSFKTFLVKAEDIVQQAHKQVQYSNLKTEVQYNQVLYSTVQLFTNCIVLYSTVPFWYASIILLYIRKSFIEQWCNVCLEKGSDQLFVNLGINR